MKHILIVGREREGDISMKYKFGSKEKREGRRNILIKYMFGSKKSRERFYN